MNPLLRLWAWVIDRATGDYTLPTADELCASMTAFYGCPPRPDWQPTPPRSTT